MLACGVLLAKAVHQPAELLYEHKSSWGGFLKGVRSANDLSINDISLLKIAERDRKKERLAAVKTERTVRAHAACLARHVGACCGRGSRAAKIWRHLQRQR